LYGGVLSYYKMCISHQIILGSLNQERRVTSALMSAYKSLLKEGYVRNFVSHYGLVSAGSGLGPVTAF